jgi:hypothetical protein
MTLTAPDVSGFSMETFVGWLNFFLPIDHIVCSLGLYAAMAVVMLTVGWVLRWAKVIR